MAQPTNVIGLVDSPLLHKVDEMLSSRESAYKFYNWYLQTGQLNSKVPPAVVGHLINEVFSLRQQLENRKK